MGANPGREAGAGRMKTVVRTQTYLADLEAIEAYIAQDNPGAAVEMWFLIDDQVEKLADSKFPRRRGRIAGTKELVAHENYVVILIEDAATVTALNVVHARRKFP
ncbi:MAG: type II toxin-antitoxin system RelE/ParE family toxin [Pigmentiphaga sp.]